jgi:hypothetical protein
MTDTAATRCRLFAKLRGKIGKLADASPDLQAGAVSNRNTSRVVSTVFQASQPANNHLGCITWANITNNPTHIRAAPIAMKEQNTQATIASAKYNGEARRD